MLQFTKCRWEFGELRKWRWGPSAVWKSLEVASHPLACSTKRNDNGSSQDHLPKSMDTRVQLLETFAGCYKILFSRAFPIYIEVTTCSGGRTVIWLGGWRERLRRSKIGGAKAPLAPRFCRRPWGPPRTDRQFACLILSHRHHVTQYRTSCDTIQDKNWIFPYKCLPGNTLNSTIKSLGFIPGTYWYLPHVNIW